MKYSLQFHPFRRTFETPIRTAYGEWRDRRGYLVRLEDEEGFIGLGEVAPMTDFGTESAEEAGAFLESLGGVWDGRHCPGDSGRRASYFGLCGAAEDLVRQRNQSAGGEDGRATGIPAGASIAVARLLPSGEENALVALETALESGFSMFKVKIATGEGLQSEARLLERLIEQAPTGEARFRLDANGGLSRDDLDAWLDWCSGHRESIDFIEQPLPAKPEGRELPALSERAARAPVPLALDESVGGLESLVRALQAGWTGPIVVKPTLFGAPCELREALAGIRNRVIFSTVFETVVGLSQLVRLALEWEAARAAGRCGASGEPEAHGLAPALSFLDSELGRYPEGADWNAEVLAALIAHRPSAWNFLQNRFRDS